MSDHIPFEIQEEIIKRLPIKSLIRCTSVSKSWKSLIHSSKFITDHCVTQPQNLLVSYLDANNSEEKYVSIVDDDTFPPHKFYLTIPLSICLLIKPETLPNKPCIIGSSHGLICCYGFDYSKAKSTVVLWNPSIRKSVAIVMPHGPYNSVMGFGVCPHTFDPKLVKITDNATCIVWQVEVFTLSSRVWRSPLCTDNLPRKSIVCTQDQVVVDGIMYWLAYDRTTIQETYNLIISFDLTSEEFGEVYLPNSLTNPLKRLIISKLKESLVVLKNYEEGGKRVCVVWMMKKNGVSKSFTKLYPVKEPIFHPVYMRVLGFRKNGEPILEKDFYKLWSEEHSNDLGIFGKPGSISVRTYMETLLLLD